MTKVTINKIMAPEESNEIGISEGESIFFFTFLLSTTKMKSNKKKSATVLMENKKRWRERKKLN